MCLMSAEWQLSLCGIMTEQKKTDMLLPVSEFYTCYLLKPVGSVFKYTQALFTLSLE